MVDLKNIEKLSDEELVSLTLKNQEDFLYLINRYQAKLGRYIRRIAGVGKEDTEDLLQDVFIKVYQNLNSFDTSLKFSSWVYRITHNEVISHWRKSKSRPEEITYEVDTILNGLTDDVDIIGDVDQKYLRQNIDKVLGTMDMKYREVLILKFLEDKDYKEIADILKKPMGTVATLINRAKSQFRKKLKESNIKL